MSAIRVRITLTVKKAWTEFCSVAAVQCNDWEMGILRLKEIKWRYIENLCEKYIYYI